MNSLHHVIAYGLLASMVSGCLLVARRRRVTVGGLALALPTVALAVVTVYMVTVVSHVYFPVQISHSDPTVTITPWLWLQGQPIYHAVDAAQRYSVVYGPVLSLIHACVYLVLGPGIGISKLAGAAAAFAALVLAYGLFRRVAGRALSILGVGVLAAFLLQFHEISFWNRADPFLMLFMVVGLWMVTASGRLPYLLGGAVALGLAMNLKIHAGVYFLPLLVHVLLSYGFARLMVLLGAAAVIMVAPFLLPNVSLPAFLSWVQAAAAHGIDLAALPHNINKGFQFSLPMIAAGLFLVWSGGGRWRSAWRDGRPWLISYLIAMTVVAVVATKPGAGNWHLLPFLPMSLYIALRALRGVEPSSLPALAGGHRRASAVMLFVTLLLFEQAMAHGLQLAGSYGRGAAEARRLIAAMAEVDRSNPGLKISMGYGDDATYPATWYRANLVFAGHPYLVDATALMDMQYAGIPIPAATLEAMARGVIDLWLIPKGGPPFSMTNIYDARPLFSAEFRAAFLGHYVRVGGVGGFDLWRYRGSPRDGAL